MLTEQQLNAQLKHTLDKTNLGIGRKYEGKVRDNYTLNGKRLIITTDRISAFDRVLCSLPFKGQVLNQVSAFWFEKTKQTVGIMHSDGFTIEQMVKYTGLGDTDIRKLIRDFNN